MNKDVKNHEIIGVYTGLAMILLSLILILTGVSAHFQIPVLANGILGMGFFILLWGIPIFSHYYYGYRQMRTIFNHKNYLGYWQTEEGENRQVLAVKNIEKIQIQNKTRIIFFLLGLIFINIYSIDYLIQFDYQKTNSILPFLGFIAGGIILFCLSIFVIPLSKSKEMKNFDDRVHISKMGFYWFGIHHSWGGYLYNLKKIIIDDNQTNVSFEISHPIKRSSFFRKFRTITIPIPPSQRNKAIQVLDDLNRSLRKKS